MRQRATSAPGRSTDPESPISAKIDIAERELHGLYLERAGQMKPGPDRGWCVQCRGHPVLPHASDDTCRACVAKLRASSAGSPA